MPAREDHNDHQLAAAVDSAAPFYVAEAVAGPGVVSSAAAFPPVASAAVAAAADDGDDVDDDGYDDDGQHTVVVLRYHRVHSSVELIVQE